MRLLISAGRWLFAGLEDLGSDEEFSHSGSLISDTAKCRRSYATLLIGPLLVKGYEYKENALVSDPPFGHGRRNHLQEKRETKLCTII